MTTQALRLGRLRLRAQAQRAEHRREPRSGWPATLLPKIRLLAERRQSALDGRHTPRQVRPGVCRKPAANAAANDRREIVAIGISTGGPSALHEMLPKLPADLPVPVVIVQHMPPKFTRSLADDLDRHCAVARRAKPPTASGCRPGTVYIAPGGQQMQHRAAPRADWSFASPTIRRRNAASRRSTTCSARSPNSSATRVLAVIMTGMGDDGTVGCQLLKQRGAQVIAQDAASCVVYGMPRQIVEHGLADVDPPARRDRRHDRPSGARRGQSHVDFATTSTPFAAW